MASLLAARHWHQAGGPGMRLSGRGKARLSCHCFSHGVRMPTSRHGILGLRLAFSVLLVFYRLSQELAIKQCILPDQKVLRTTRWYRLVKGQLPSQDDLGESSSADYFPCIRLEPPTPARTPRPSWTHPAVLAALAVCAHSIRLQSAGAGVTAAIGTFLRRGMGSV